jgi:hypothetical protein
MEEPVFTDASLSDVRVIIAIMTVTVEELLCQAVMRQILVLEYLLFGARGRLWLCPVVPGIKCYLFLRSRL